MVWQKQARWVSVKHYTGRSFCPASPSPGFSRFWIDFTFCNSASYLGLCGLLLHELGRERLTAQLEGVMHHGISPPGNLHNTGKYRGRAPSRIGIFFLHNTVSHSFLADCSLSVAVYKEVSHTPLACKGGSEKVFESCRWARKKWEINMETRDPRCLPQGWYWNWGSYFWELKCVPNSQVCVRIKGVLCIWYHSVWGSKDIEIT